MIATILAAAAAETTHVSGEAWTAIGAVAVAALAYLGTRFSERKKLDAAVQIEKDKQESARAAEAATNAAKLEAEKEKHQASLDAEKAKQEAALVADRERHAAELEIEKARSENSRAAAMESEIRRLRDLFWKNQTALQQQLSEQRQEIDDLEEDNDALREHIYLGKPPPPPERKKRDRKRTPPIDLEAMNPMNFGMVPNESSEPSESTDTGSIYTA